MKAYRWLWVIIFACFIMGCAKAGTHLVRVQYQSMKEFPSLQEKIGPTLGLVPIKDERQDQLYIGSHTHYRGSVSYFKSDPLPLDQAMTDSISQALSRFGVKTVPMTQWDGKPGSLSTMATDSVLMVELKRFWLEGRAGEFRTTMKTSAHLVIHLGVKKEGKVFTRNIEVQKENTWPRLTPERVEGLVNQTLTEIFDGFFVRPYE